MDIFDQLHEVLDIFDKSSQNNTTPNIATMYEWASKSADLIVLVSDKEKQKEAILKLLEEAYVKGAEAKIEMK
jgi:hypothetical protein